MVRFRSVLASSLCVLAALGAQAYAAGPDIPNLWDAKERLPKPDLSTLPRLRFLTTTDFPPFNFLDANGRLSGFHVDLARAVCGELGISDRCQIQALPWADLDGALRSGQGEAIISGVAISPETRRQYAFSRPYLQFPARFIMPRATAAAEPIFDLLKGKRVGVVAGSAHERMLRDYFPDATVVAYTGQDLLLADLKVAKIDAAFGDGMRFGFWLAGPEADGCCRFAGGPYLAPEYLGLGLSIAAKADDPALAAAFDYALHEISVKGTFAELYLRYFPVSFY
jgi:polar amino acid transport system substrate-binding protein